MLFDIDSDGIVRASVREICEFLKRSGDAYAGSLLIPTEKMKKGAAFHRDFQKKQEKLLSDYSAEVRLSLETELSDSYTLILSGIADGISDGDEGIIIDEIKTVSRDVKELSFGSIPKYDLQLYCYAYMYLLHNEKKQALLRLIYHNLDSKETNVCECKMTFSELSEIFLDACRELLRWVKLYAEGREQCILSAKDLTFPFDSYRKGQRELCAATYRCMRDGHNLFAEAPTGIGKTLSALFPAYKSMGEGNGKKVFYLTAKAVQREIATDAIELMKQKGLNTRYCVLTAKTKSCLSDNDCSTSECIYSDGCFDRMNEALWDILNSETVITADTAREYSRKHKVCPHELMLDCTYFCDCIIGDYNHLYDPRAFLQRYFSVGGDYIALVDEAHNLPDRASEMFSASISALALSKAHKELSGAPPKMRREFSRLSKIIFSLFEDENDIDLQYRLLPESERGELEDVLSELCEKYKSFLAKGGFEAQKRSTAQVFFDCSFLDDMTRLAKELPHCFKAYIKRYGRDVQLFYTCTNPSPLILDTTEKIRSTIFFSATLCPFKYYTELLSMDEKKDKYILLPSPFPSENRLVAVYPSISTKLKNRGESSYERAADIIYSAITARVGNYLAFFPSFGYLEKAFEVFQRKYPDVKTVIQSSNMNREEQLEFLRTFDDYGSRTLVGFAVCGGLFSEGIDLTGERLSGVVIFGTGMPSISFERDLIRESFDVNEDKRRGFSYAYTYPGLNKVFQAAGRVIRRESDKGFILLCEERYTHEEYTRHFPEAWWDNLTRVYSCSELEAALKRFWDSFDG